MQQRQVKRWSGRHAERVRPMDHQLPAEDLPRAQFLAERAFTTLQRFLHVEAISGGVLLIAAAAALLWANSPSPPRIMRSRPDSAASLGGLRHNAPVRAGECWH